MAIIHNFSKRFAAYTLLIITGLIGQVSLMALGLFLFHGSFDLVRLGLGETASLGLNTCLCLLFFIQHSIMVRKSYRQWLSRFVRKEFHSALYTIASGIVLLAIVLFWQKSAHTFAAADGMFYWLLRGCYFLSIAGFVWGNMALGSFDSFGLNPILSYLRGTQPEQLDFTVRGPYQWVRHPLYFFSLLMIWSCPDITMDRLLFNLLFTTWMMVGMLMEERYMIASFGEAYLNYRKKVPMLVPRYICPDRNKT
ncbi:MAG: isoprenylcysteine carboxylmethyltransferase family protein [Deltaproteobacteria bacterium]|nr:isoprenylcysteine carboxylmethyltransferase family protein [Deltaproteobacteria bacterium]